MLAFYTEETADCSMTIVQLSIYPAPEAELVLIEEPTQLEQQIGSVRRTLTSSYQESYGYVQGWVSKWIGVEHAIESAHLSIQGSLFQSADLPSLNDRTCEVADPS